jgi:hypothetical protein
MTCCCCCCCWGGACTRIGGRLTWCAGRAAGWAGLLMQRGDGEGHGGQQQGSSRAGDHRVRLHSSMVTCTWCCNAPAT